MNWNILFEFFNDLQDAPKVNAVSVWSMMYEIRKMEGCINCRV